jgi:DNA-directed RNA polymerase subunit M/transcription elongation factor TFIIS
MLLTKGLDCIIDGMECADKIFCIFIADLNRRRIKHQSRISRSASSTQQHSRHRISCVGPGMWKAKLKAETIQSFERSNGRIIAENGQKDRNCSATTKGKKVEEEQTAKATREREEKQTSEIVEIPSSEREVPSGKRALECKSCHKMKAYMYNSFSKRGGRKSLYRCVECQNQWSEFECDEEDYDFLSG